MSEQEEAMIMERETVSFIFAVVAMILGGISIGMGISNLAYILHEIRKNSKDSGDNTGNTEHDI